MKTIGVTGGIGSGKSTVCRIFSVLGAPVYDCDARAKELMESDPKLVEKIKAAFGCEAYSGGRLNRVWLAARVFNDRQALETLNGLVHPAVRADMKHWLDRVESPVGYAVVESAILFESCIDREVDFTVAVAAPEELRIRRVTERDGVPPDRVRARMANQMSDEERAGLVDFVINNDERNLVWQQAIAINKLIRNEIRNR